MKTECRKKISNWWRANIGWYLLVLLVGAWLHHREVQGYGLPLLVMALVGGLFLGRMLWQALKEASLPLPAAETSFRSGAFVENLRTDVRVIVARMSLCVVEEWRISRGLPLPTILREFPLLNTLTWLKDETVLRMVARDNRVQYCVSLSDLVEQDVHYDPQSGKLSLHLPELALDEDLVEVQSDSSKIWMMTEKGFYDRMTDWLSGGTHKTKTLMRDQLRELVIAQAKSEENLALARKNATLELCNIVKILASKTGPHPVSSVDISFGDHRELGASSNNENS